MKVVINKVDQNNFVAFVNRLKVIDSFVYFKLKGDQIISSAYLPQRDAVKHHTIPVSELFQIDASQLLTEKDLKIAFFDANKLIEAFKQFEYDSIQAEIEFVENEEDCVASTFKIFNDELEITLACSEPSLGYKDLTESQLQNIFNTEGSEVTFDLSYTDVSKIKALFNLDKDETFSISTSKEGVRIKGKSYNKIVNPTSVAKANVLVYKKYLNLFDKEDYSTYLFNNRVVLRSKDSNTLLTIATCQNAD
jgi:hypothetical protein